MATQKWLAGTSWASLFGSEVNSVVNGNAVLSSIQVDNTSNLDTYMDISVSLGSITSGAGSPYIGFYLYPLNQDGTTYGDGQFGSSAAGPPPGAYLIGQIPVIASTTGVITGTLRGIVMPEGKFKVIMHNQAGATLAGSSNTLKYQTYNLQVA